MIGRMQFFFFLFKQTNKDSGVCFQKTFLLNLWNSLAFEQLSVVTKLLSTTK